MMAMRTFEDFRAAGLLWLVNRHVFHPMGYALTFHIDTETKRVLGWSIQGDGREVWSFAEKDDDAGFHDVKRFFASLSAEQAKPVDPSVGGFL